MAKCDVKIGIWMFLETDVEKVRQSFGLDFQKQGLWYSPIHTKWYTILTIHFSLALVMEKCIHAHYSSYSTLIQWYMNVCTNVWPKSQMNDVLISNCQIYPESFSLSSNAWHWGQGSQADFGVKMKILIILILFYGVIKYDGL